MAQYRVGIASITSGTNIVTFEADVDGIAPQLLLNATAGDFFRIGTSEAYVQILSVDSDTQLTLVANSSTSWTDEDYDITRDFSPSCSLPLPNQGDTYFAALMKRALLTIDGLIGSADFTGRVSYCGFFFGTPAATANGYERRIKVKGPADAPVIVESIQIIHADGWDSESATSIRVSTERVGVSGAQWLECQIESGEENGGESDPEEFLTVQTGDYLYVYIQDAGGHQNPQFLITTRFAND